MTAFFIGYGVACVTAVLALAALCAWDDRRGKPLQPTTVRDPETGALWTEHRKVDIYL